MCTKISALKSKTVKWAQTWAEKLRTLSSPILASQNYKSQSNLCLFSEEDKQLQNWNKCCDCDVSFEVHKTQKTWHFPLWIENGKWDMWSFDHCAVSEGLGMSDSREVCYHCDVCYNIFTSPDNITDQKKTYHQSARLNTVSPTKCNTE